MSSKSIITILVLVVLAGGVAWAWKGTGLVRPPAEPDENAASSTPEEPATVNLKVFFGNRLTDPGSLYCERVYPALREVPKTEGVARAALEQLFSGPTEEEKARGFVTGINPGVKIQSLEVENGVAYVDLNSRLEEGVGGSCLVTAIRAQITETLKQFSAVSSVVISVNGRSEDILQP